jgi:DNA repair protein RAD57
MTDISIVLPDFQTAPYAHLITPLERAGITTGELLCAQPADIARKAQVPPTAAAKLIDAVIEALHVQVKEERLPEWKTISFLDAALDEAWQGGAPTRYLTEITGER